MEYWDNFDQKLGNVTLGPEAGEWAVVAMACVAYADLETNEEEIARAATLIEKSAVISQTLGADQAKRLFDHELQALQLNPAGELSFQKARLREMASSIITQEDRDAAFFMLVSMATADRQITVPEYKILQEFKEMVGSKMMIPMPQVQC